MEASTNTRTFAANCMQSKAYGEDRAILEPNESNLSTEMKK
jgi:hypothetical protein